jgi:hypothetical protein
MEGLLITFVIFAGISVVLSRLASSPTVKGQLGEWAVQRKLEKSLSSTDYTILRDVTLQTHQGTTQIDHVVVSPFGIFVIETKNMSGWIFGAEHDAQWTQSLYRSKVRFQNPLRQNYAHVRALQELLGLDTSKFHSVVVFTGKAEFKKTMPTNVMPLSRLVPYIEIRTTPLLGVDEVRRSVATIESSRLATGAATNAAHIQSLRATHQSIDGAIQDARGLMRHGIKTLIAVKAAVGVLLMVFLVMAGGYMLKNVSEVLSGGSARPTTSVVTPDSTGNQVRQQSSSSPSAQRFTLFPNTQALLEKNRQDQAARERQKSEEQQRAWRESLMCGYSMDTMRCTCYDPKGGKVAMSFDECKRLADESGP